MLAAIIFGSLVRNTYEGQTHQSVASKVTELLRHSVRDFNSLVLDRDAANLKHIGANVATCMRPITVCDIPVLRWIRLECGTLGLVKDVVVSCLAFGLDVLGQLRRPALSDPV